VVLAPSAATAISTAADAQGLIYLPVANLLPGATDPALNGPQQGLVTLGVAITSVWGDQQTGSEWLFSLDGSSWQAFGNPQQTHSSPVSLHSALLLGPGHWLAYKQGSSSAPGLTFHACEHSCWFCARHSRLKIRGRLICSLLECWRPTGPDQ